MAEGTPCDAAYRRSGCGWDCNQVRLRYRPCALTSAGVSMVRYVTLQTVTPALLLLTMCAKPKSATPWVPGVSYTTQEQPVYRGLLDRRGLIHAHNFASHDACADDGASANQGASSNQNCFDEFRNDICAAQHDFVFLSDHGNAEFNTTEYPTSSAATAAIPANAEAAKYPPFLEGGNTMLYVQADDP